MLLLFTKKTQCVHILKNVKKQGYDNIKLANNIEFALLASKQDLAKLKIFPAKQISNFVKDKILLKTDSFKKN
jgi:hypothetical protein